MNPAEAAAAGAGGCIAAAVLLLIIAIRRPDPIGPTVAAPMSPLARRSRRLREAVRRSVAGNGRRMAGWCLAGVGVWVVTGWPVAGLALAGAGAWLPWLLGSARVARDRIELLEALESWCRRMADTLAGGGAIGLAQAIAVTAPRVDEPIAVAVQALAGHLRSEQGDPSKALREFADTVDDRSGDAVAAALLLALHQQGNGISEVLRQLADGVARDVRARRDIEAERAESRQSIRILLLIQAGVLTLMALVPTFAVPYRTPLGQLVMALLMAGTITLLIWMRRLAIGKQAPRFLGNHVKDGAP